MANLSICKVRAILKRKAKISPEVVAKAKAILKQRSQKAINLSSSDSGSDSSDSTESDLLSLAPSSKGYSTDEVPTFRLLEKNLKAMEVDMENGHVQSVRIEV